jgi:hypothetical protein
MEHLTDIEILRFVNITFDNDAADETVRRVNCHILECRECAAKLKKAVSFYDTVSAMSQADFSALSLPVSEFDIEGEEVSAAAAELLGRGQAYNY